MMLIGGERPNRYRALPWSERGRAAIAAMRAMGRVERPDRVWRNLAVTMSVGPTIAGAVAGATARYPNGPAVISPELSLTYAQLWRASQCCAATLRACGVDARSTVGLLAGNSVEFVVGLVAASIIGADVVLLNTEFAAPQLADVVEREGCSHVLASPTYVEMATGTVEVVEVVAPFGEDGASVVPIRREAQIVILTSGTTGTPKGARRRGGSPLTAAAFLERVPVRSGDTAVIACPLFHAWGLSHLLIALAFASTIVIDPKMKPAAVPGVIEEHRASGLVVVPAVLARILASDGPGDTSSLRYIASSGSALRPSTVLQCQARFGDVLYNVYGSTEVALATVATPTDLAANPATAGRRVAGVRIELLDDDGAPVVAGMRGRIFVGSQSAFDGYTGGGDKERIGSLVATGDVGHFDGEQLIIDGRSDDMIVSGGENVFPGEIEDAIACLVGVAEVAVVGVPDDEFGQRLVAFVVGDGLTADDVQAAVRSNLARFKVPREVTFVDGLPRTTTGKVRRNELAGE